MRNCRKHLSFSASLTFCPHAKPRSLTKDGFSSLSRDFLADQGETGFSSLEEVVDFWNVSANACWVEFPVGEEYWIPFCWWRGRGRGGQAISLTVLDRTRNEKQLKKFTNYKFLWWSRGQESMLPVQGAWVWSLVRELHPTSCNWRACVLLLRPGAAKYINTKKKVHQPEEMLNRHRHSAEALPSGIPVFIEICSYSRLFRYLLSLFIRITATVQTEGEF